MDATAPIKIPSFVYRQDGHELSYAFFCIITPRRGLVKRPWKNSTAEAVEFSAKCQERREIKKRFLLWKVTAHGCREFSDLRIAVGFERVLTNLKIKSNKFMNDNPFKTAKSREILQ